MSIDLKGVLLFSSGCLLLGAGLTASGCVGSSEAQSPWSTWSTIRFRAKSVPLMSGRVEMRVREEEGRIVLETQTRAKFLGAVIARSRSESILDPASGRSERYVTVSKKRGRRYIFDDGGYTAEKLKPSEDPEAPPEQWTVVSSERFDRPRDESGRPVEIYDYFGMLIRLRETALQQPGDEATVFVATKRGPIPFTLRVAEARTAERTFLDMATGKDKTLPTRELRLRVSAADPAHSDEGFLKMEGETELWLEADSKTILEIGGKVPRVPGRVQLVLSAMDWPLTLDE